MTDAILVGAHIALAYLAARIFFLIVRNSIWPAIRDHRFSNAFANDILAIAIAVVAVRIFVVALIYGPARLLDMETSVVQSFQVSLLLRFLDIAFAVCVLSFVKRRDDGPAPWLLVTLKAIGIWAASIVIAMAAK